MFQAQISGTGLFTPDQSISNDELVASFNQYVQEFNHANRDAIASGTVVALEESSAEFIEKASGIKNRYVLDKAGILDTSVMHPLLPERSNDDNSILCEMGIAASQNALAQAGRGASDVDQVIVACSNLQRAYPAIAIELQSAMGIEGYAYDMNVACSSATFALQAAVSAVQSGAARRVLIVNPEVCSAHLNFRDRDSHFIFGDVCTALLVENSEDATNSGGQVFSVVDARLKTQFSNNIRNNFGFLNRCAPGTENNPDKLFVQNGRKVFKEVCPMVADMILDLLAGQAIEPSQVKRLWLHQANLNMNTLIAKRVLGREPQASEAPTVLDKYANTSSAGSIIAFHQYKDDFQSGELGVICSFGAGYSAGAMLVKRQ